MRQPTKAEAPQRLLEAIAAVIDPLGMEGGTPSHVRASAMRKARKIWNIVWREQQKGRAA